MRLAYVTHYDARDPTRWSGTTSHIAKALEAQGVKLDYIGPLREQGALLLKARQWTYAKLRGQALHRDRERKVLDGYARQVERALARSAADIVFSPGTIAIAHLRTDRPIAFWTDATYGAIVGEYTFELPTAPRSQRLGFLQEKSALSHSALCIYSSDWAAQSAVELYGTDPAKVKVVPFGANIAEHRTLDEVTRLIDARPRDRCRLVFAGVGWQRKGGEVAIEVARLLNERGVACELVMLGSDPPRKLKLPAFVSAVGFIDKRTPAGRARFDELFGSSHFFILPARAEAFGVVLCEANSFGLPNIATRVGGIPTIVRDGVNGLLFAKDDARAMAAAIEALFKDWPRYRALAVSSFCEYRSRLNWEVAGSAVKHLLEKLLQK